MTSTPERSATPGPAPRPREVPREPTWLGLLADELGTAVVTDPDVVAAHERDQAATVASGRATCLVRARTIDDVVATLRIADEYVVPVVTRGAGSGLSGGANALDGCILLSVAAMDRLVDLDVATRTAVVEPGLVNADLDAAAAAVGLAYAPDPASRSFSTLGGNIATNAGGSCCLKYGVTRDHVAQVVVVLAGGEVVRLGSTTAKDVAGLDLLHLVVGSEGTLGVIVEATMRLVPRPGPPATLVATFPTVEAAGAATVEMAAQSGLSMLEFMDRATVRAVDEHRRMGLDTSAAALVLAQSDTASAAADVEQAAELCDRHGATEVFTTDDAEMGAQLLEARRQALPALEAKGACLLDDVAVPLHAIPALLRRVAEVGVANEVEIACFGHAGDGNVHPTIVYDAADPGAQQRATAAFDAILDIALDLGGTVTGEHGVGSLKRPALARQLPAANLALMDRVKAAFDPHGILNPGRGW